MIFTHTFNRIIFFVGIIVFTGSVVPSVQAQSEVLTVAAANSLKDVFRKILPLFEAQNPHISVRVIYAQPKTLIKQIEEGAPVDVLLPAQFEDFDQLEKKGLILQDTKHVYARTALVLITNAAFPAQLDSIQDLETKPVRYIAIGDPTASAVGKDSIQFLRQRKLEPRLKSQFIYGEHSRAVLDLVSMEKRNSESSIKPMRSRQNVCASSTRPLPTAIGRSPMELRLHGPHKTLRGRGSWSLS